jgi:hypothetical protein
MLMGTLLHITQLTSMTCDVHGCGITFAIPTSLYDRANDDHDVWFWCPNGHHIHFMGETERQRAERRAARLERQLANRDEDVRSARASLIATKGHLTRAKKRADNGICQHCNRSFRNVADHVRTEHPEAVSNG